MNIAVYGGGGTGKETREGVKAFLTHAGISWQELMATDVPRIKLNEFDGFYIPGGWAWPYIRDITPEGKRALRDFVASGGRYIGVCAGSYFAADLIKWEGRFIEYDLDLFRGLAHGPIDAIQPWKGWCLTKLHLEPSHPVNAVETRPYSCVLGRTIFQPSSTPAYDGACAVCGH